MAFPEYEDQSPPAGRPVHLQPATPGLWVLLAGGAVAVLAPLFGFLIGTVAGAERDSLGLGALQLGLLLGVIAGGCGVAIAIAGGVRLMRHLQGESGRE